MRTLILSSFCLANLAAMAAPAGFQFTGAPIRDEVFWQEIGSKAPSSTALNSVAVVNGAVFAGTAKGLLSLKGAAWSEVAGVTGPVNRLKRAGTNLWAFTPKGAFSFGGSDWRREGTNIFSDVTEHLGKVVFAGGKGLFVQDISGGFSQIGTNDAPFAMARAASFQESIFVQGGARLTTFDGVVFGGKDMYGFPADQAWDWGALPSQTVRDILAVGPRLLLATDRGVGVLRGMTLTALRGADGLPFEDTTCLAAGFTNDVWIGTARGAIRQVGLGAEFHYFAGERWLPNERVNGIAVEGRKVYVATDGGMGIIEYVPMTLAKKAEYYERHLEAWGQKRLGLVHKLEWDEPLGEFVREAGDNDGGYSSDYLAAQSYRYAVTRDPAARAEAVNTFQALNFLQKSTGIPGFPARSIWAVGEVGHKATGGSGGYAAEWHATADGKFEWKGDTSSDELCAHFYAIGIFLELAAPEAEAQKARQQLADVASHLIDHQWRLVDIDGKPTRWGRWDPDYFLTEEGRFDRGLQSVEILSFMKMAGVVTPDAAARAKFAKAYGDLVRLGYPAYTLRERQVFPSESVLHFEDQLAFWSYWNLLRHETDPALRSMYRRSFERTWEILRVEQQPWFNFVYAALTGNEAEFGPAAAHLREWPLDLRIWSFQNSHRADLQTPPGYVALKASPRAFSPREREPMRWDAWTMQADGGTGGRDVVEPSGWLLAYWMGRYYGFIEAPAAGAIAAEVDPLRGGLKGARPYSGPALPKL
jgi:hypothetical protein